MSNIQSWLSDLDRNGLEIFITDTQEFEKLFRCRSMTEEELKAYNKYLSQYTRMPPSTRHNKCKSSTNAILEMDDKAFMKKVRMSKLHFFHLLRIMTENNILKSGHTNISAADKLLLSLQKLHFRTNMFEVTSGHGMHEKSFPRIFREVREGLLKLSHLLLSEDVLSFNIPQTDITCHNEQMQEEASIFQKHNALNGAIDGVVFAIGGRGIAQESRIGHFNYKHNQVSINVTASVNRHGYCDFISEGFAGTSNDTTCYKSCMVTGHLADKVSKRPKLGDGGYVRSMGVLTPYAGARYHNQEYAVMHSQTGHLGAGARHKLLPRNRFEVFNHGHARFRVRVENEYGQLKNKYQAVAHRLEFDELICMELIECSLLLLNWTQLDHLRLMRARLIAYQQLSLQVNTLEYQMPNILQRPSSTPEATRTTQAGNLTKTDIAKKFKEDFQQPETLQSLMEVRIRLSLALERCLFEKLEKTLDQQELAKFYAEYNFDLWISSHEQNDRTEERLELVKQIIRDMGYQEKREELIRMYGQSSRLEDADYVEEVLERV